MPFELYLAFVLATTILILSPGPNVTLIVANSLAYGVRHALTTVAGTSTAIAVQLALVVLGTTSIMAILADWFDGLRWLGVAYLVWLGIQHWRSSSMPSGETPAVSMAPFRLYWQGFLVSLTNPKVLLFLAAFFPQFVDPGQPPLPQLLLLSATYLTIGIVFDGGYALLADRVRPWIGGERRARFRDRVTGTLLIGAGVWLALARRN
jgi:threonine/homoserine/homoserine lactone efflux protein